MAEKTLNENRQLKTEVTTVKKLAERKLATQVLVQVLNTKVRCVWGNGLPGPSLNYAIKETQAKQTEGTVVKELAERNYLLRY